MRESRGEDLLVCMQSASLFVFVLSVQCSVVDDNGSSHPQAWVRMWRGEDQPLRRALGNPAQGDLLTRLPASVPQLGAGQQPPGSPAQVETRQDISAEEDTRVWSKYQ